MFWTIVGALLVVFVVLPIVVNMIKDVSETRDDRLREERRSKK
jgi:F0F1-type ATP synthase membrane subunit b/b'